jgi:rifampicin phosphotransferase
VKLTIPLTSVGQKDRMSIGGKGFALSMMIQKGINVPPALCVTTLAYRRYVELTGLKVRIGMELNRKSFEEMRWEEIWDTALRIRNMFSTTPIPVPLRSALGKPLQNSFSDSATVVRSSAPGEDSAKTSFAGLHESFVNVKGVDAILDHIRLVWASLWSDAALLYRKELGLDIEGSSMAVLVQEIVEGEKSGVVFGRNPDDDSQTVIEAVHGLNEGLVSGKVEPDLWLLDRKTGAVLSHKPVVRDKAMMTAPEGLVLVDLPTPASATPPLDEGEIKQVFAMVLDAEELFNAPQDMEWTFRNGELFTLQSRPITTLSAGGNEDKRPWYLSLHRSFENLRGLRKRVEEELIPEMIGDAERLSLEDLSVLPDSRLIEEITRRGQIYQKWADIYSAEFIPLAHGIRLFGALYNDTVNPTDPYEFVDLLGATAMVSLERNRVLEQLSSLIRENPGLAQNLRGGVWRDTPFGVMLFEFMEKFGGFFGGILTGSTATERMITLLLEMASQPPAQERLEKDRVAQKVERFLSHFTGQKRAYAEEVLELGRASYRLRDNDNLYLARVQTEVMRAIEEHSGRAISSDPLGDLETLLPRDAFTMVRQRFGLASPGETGQETVGGFAVRSRQLVGQPAGPGLATGTARVVVNTPDLFAFKSGEILVCDAVDPTMTFIVPLSTAIVERRGGMLIHGSIIAREYGIPCVTGVPDAISLIKTGEALTVDGYLGIVIIG